MLLDVDLAWSAPITDFDGSRDTADPLGFRAFANQLARDLVPGLTQATWRTRGYSLLCKGLSLALDAHKNKGTNPVEVFLRFERLWVGAQRAVHGQAARWVGIRMADLLLEADLYRLDRPLTTQQLYSGIWGAYRRSATALGLIQPQGRHSGPAGYALTSLGRGLADAANQAAFSARVQLAKHVTKPSLATEFLRTLVPAGQPGHIPSKAEVAGLSAAMAIVDQACDRALHRLRRVYDDARGAELDLDALDGADLNDMQMRAAEAARQLLELMETIEKPYRLWVTGSSDESIPAAIWKHAGWETIRQWPVPELAALHDSVRSAEKGSAVFEALHKHHAQLMEQRGAEPWEKDIETLARSTYQAPDFCLPSASRLFAEGVLAGASE